MVTFGNPQPLVPAVGQGPVVLVDAQANVRALASRTTDGASTAASLFDGNLNAKATVAVADDGRIELALFDSEKRLRCWIELIDDQGPLVRFFNEDGSEV